MGRFNNVNVKPVDMLRTFTIVAGHIVYIMTAWADVKYYDNFGIVLFGQFLLSYALVLSVFDNFGWGVPIPFRSKIKKVLLRFFNWLEKK